MLNIVQRKTVFAIFCFSTIILLCLEVFLIYHSLVNGVAFNTALATFLSTSLLGGAGLIFKRIVENNFVNQEFLPMIKLHRLATDRSRIAEGASSGGQDDFEIRKQLVENTLRFVEETLQGWGPGSHFEICVFVDSAEPLLFSYYDSNHDNIARSMKLREADPNFYIAKGYEVTKVLSNPSSQPHIINDTHAATTGYTFTTSAQKQQIGSTFLLSLDLNKPLALVVSSSVRGAFNKNDPKMISFLRYAGELIRSDLISDAFLDKIRELRPELFKADPIVYAHLLTAPIEAKD